MFLIYIDSRNFVLAADSRNAILTVLENHNVFVEDGFSFTRHDPLRRMNLTTNNLTNSTIVNLFMQNSTALYVQETPEGGMFSTEFEQVVFYNGAVTYTNLGLDISFSNEMEKRLFATNIIRSLGEAGRYFSLDKIETNNGEILSLSYRQLYRNNRIYSNYIIFIFYQNNLQTIQFNFNPVVGFFGEARTLRPADEILLTFLRNIDRQGIYPTVVIESMDIVYVATNLIASPYYRINFWLRGERTSKLINAYIGDIRS